MRDTLSAFCCLGIMLSKILHSSSSPYLSDSAFEILADSMSPYLTPNEFSRAANMSVSDFSSDNADENPRKDPETKRKYFEGDMMVERKKFEDIMFVPKMWPNGRIPYLMEPRFTIKERKAIARAMLTLHERTCVQFVPKDGPDFDFVHIVKDRGCAAHVGKHGGEQFVILGAGCFSIGTIVHELMHALGFIHEQSRPDRDSYVKIHWDNIRENRKSEFRRHKEDYFHKNGFPYDLYSVMHYREFAFSKNGLKTIEAKEDGVDLRCNGFGCPTDMDIKKINHFYECNKKGANNNNNNNNNYADNHHNEINGNFGDRLNSIYVEHNKPKVTEKHSLLKHSLADRNYKANVDAKYAKHDRVRDKHNKIEPAYDKHEHHNQLINHIKEEIPNKANQHISHVIQIRHDRVYKPLNQVLNHQNVEHNRFNTTQPIHEVLSKNNINNNYNHNHIDKRPDTSHKQNVDTKHSKYDKLKKLDPNTNVAQQEKQHYHINDNAVNRKSTNNVDPIQLVAEAVSGDLNRKFFSAQQRNSSNGNANDDPLVMDMEGSDFIMDNYIKITDKDISDNFDFDMSTNNSLDSDSDMTDPFKRFEAGDLF